MVQKHDFQKDWARAKKHFMKFSQEAAVLAKKGEKELIKISRQGKLHLDSTTATLKKEQLFYQIGKEYISANCPTKPNARLNGLLRELDRVNKEISRVRNKLTAKSAVRKRKGTSKRATKRTKRKTS